MLKFLCLSFVAHYFFMCTWIEFVFGMMIDTGLKFLSAVSAFMIYDRDLEVKVTDLEF